MSIHPTAVIDSSAKIGPDCSIGAYAVIDAGVTLGAGCVVHPLARIMGNTTLGARNVVHSGAVLGDWPQDRKYHGEPASVVIGDDNVFREGSTVHCGTGNGSKTVIGNRGYFMVQSHVGHNCVVGDDVMLVNSAALGGHVVVGERAIIGAHCSVHQFCRVGRLAMISNGACANVDIPPFFISMTTNSITQLNVVGLRRIQMPHANISALREVFQAVFRNSRMVGPALDALSPALLAVPQVEELRQFCKATKRGIARFSAWSERSKASGSSENRDEQSVV